MKLSEAILLGSTLRPQKRGHLYGVKWLRRFFRSKISFRGDPRFLWSDPVGTGS